MWYMIMSYYDNFPWWLECQDHYHNVQITIYKVKCFKLLSSFSILQAVALVLVSFSPPSRGQLIGDIDKDALKALVEEQENPEKDSEFEAENIQSLI